jgi:hypothetical protein
LPRAVVSPRTLRPTATDPVNDTARTSGEATTAAPAAGPRPITTLTTPGGSPAAVRQRAKCIALSGASSEGLSTTVLPAARAGAAFQAGIATGKFHGVISPTTPSGRRSV